MAIKFQDGFDSYSAGVDPSKRWGSVGAPWTWTAGAGRNGGAAMVAATTGGGFMRTRAGTFGAVSGLSFAGWIKISAPPAAETDLIQFLNTNQVGVVGLRITAAGLITYRDITFANNKFTGSTNVADNQWHWVEFHATAANSTNTRCYVDTVQQWNATQSTNASNLDTIQFQSFASRTITIDDVVFFDATGTIVPTDIPLGPREITTRRPNGDSATAFSRLSGSDSFAMINEVAQDGDTSYNDSPNSGDQDLFDYENLGFTPAAINAIVVVTTVENPNPGTINWRAAAKSNATTVNGTSVVAPSSYQTYQETYVTDPNGAVAWTQSAFDAAKFGYNVV